MPHLGHGNCKLRSVTSSDRSSEVPDTSCSSVPDGSHQTGSPFLRNGVGTLRTAEDSRFGAFSLEGGCTRGLSSSSYSAETVVRSGRTRGLSSSSSSSSWARAGYAHFRCDRAKVTCFLREPIAHATMARCARLANPTQCVPLWTTRLEKSTSQNLGMSSWLHMDPVWCNTQVLHLRNGESDRHVASLRVVHCGFVGK